ncbi:MAG: uracil-DNA glycosylase [Bacilli bacterium]|jgi:uracil-DNA glycosylase|nr:uracil-DNA glycosylase [Bacilli bacterium]
MNFKESLFNNIDASWLDFINNSILNDTTFIMKLENEYLSNTCYPDVQDILRVFSYPENSIKVVILGQDPYHSKGVADGLAFSCKQDKIPPSLNNIFKEINNDLNIINTNPDLSKWAKQGIMLLNTKLSVKAGLANSHNKLGWEKLIIPLIKYLDKKDLIFVLWGNDAKKYKQYIINSYVIEGAHPSPFSYHLFKNNNYFSKINELLVKQHKQIIDWHTE